MLGRSSYDQDYIDTCRVKVAAQLSAYEALATAARERRAARRADRRL